MMALRIFAGLLASALVAAPATAQALDSTWVFQAGAYFPKVNSSVRVDSSDGTIGTDIDLERDLGFERNNILPALRAEWRPGDDWVVNAEYYAIGRSSTKSLERDITIGDTTYPVDATVGAGFDSDVFRFTVGNRLIQRPNLEIGVAIGLHGTDFTVFFEGEGSAGDESVAVRSENRSVFAPLPTIGAFLNARPHPKVHVNARIDWLSLTISDYSGRLFNTEASAAYSITKNIDLGLMYRFVDYRVRVEKPDWNGRVNYQFSGPLVFVQVGF